MWKDFEQKFHKITGDFNHAIIGLILMGLASLLKYFTDVDIHKQIAFMVSFFYLGKEHGAYSYLGEIASFNMLKWSKHDRNQTILVWISVWVYYLLS